MLELTIQSQCGREDRRVTENVKKNCVAIAEFQYFNSHSNSCTLTLISPANFTTDCVARFRVWRPTKSAGQNRVQKMHIRFTSILFRVGTNSKPHFVRSPFAVPKFE